MTIDHASREPEPPDPPIGTSSDAARNLFGPGGEPRPSPGFDMRVLTWAAVVHAGGQATGKFKSGDFAQVVRIKFDLKDAPSKEWCRDVLVKLEWVTAYPGGDYYKVQTG